MILPKEMTFLEHLRELRQRAVRVVLVTLVAFFVCWNFHVELFDLLSAPIQEGLIRHGIYQFKALQVTEPIMVYLKVSLLGAIVIGSPYFIIQMWFFVSPGLLRHEKRAALPVIFFGSFFFLLGVVFCYRVLLPFLTDFLVGVGEESASVSVDVTLQSALSYGITFLVIFGIVFELPLVLFFMTVLGITSPKKLISFGRYWLVLAFAIGAIFTPPDPASQVMMAVPLIVLYWIGVGASLAADHYRKKNADQLGAEGDGVGRIWGVTGAVLFALLFLGFSWTLLPRGGVHPLAWVDPKAPVVVGLQPRILEARGLWRAARAELVEAVPAAAPLLEDEKWRPDLVAIQLSPREPAMITVAGPGVHEQVRAQMIGDLESRGEGSATVYGTRAVLRSGQGTVIACVDELCAIGRAAEVMEAVREHRAGLLSAPEGGELDRLRTAGPAWGHVRASALVVLGPQVVQALAEKARAVRFWLRPTSENALELHALVRTEEGSEPAAMEEDVRALATALADGGRELGASNRLEIPPRALVDLLLGRTGPVVAAAPTVALDTGLRLRPPDLEVLLDTGRRPSPKVPELARPVAALLGAAPRLARVQVLDHGVEVVWER